MTIRLPSESVDGSVRPVLVMIPGTLCDERLFAFQRRALRGVATLHLASFSGLSRRRDWAGTLLRELPSRFSLAGFSLGGLWALELLRRAPDRVERLAMIASNAGGGSALAKRRSAWLWRVWRRQGAGAVARQVKPGYFHHEACRRRYARLVHEMAMRTSSEAADAEFSWAASRPDGKDVLSSFNGPVLLISGARDRLCPPPIQKTMLQAQPRANWLELPRVGHFVPLEAPAQLSDALRRWLSEPGAGTQTQSTVQASYIRKQHAHRNADQAALHSL